MYDLYANFLALTKGDGSGVIIPLKDGELRQGGIYETDAIEAEVKNLKRDGYNIERERLPSDSQEWTCEQCVAWAQKKA